MQNHDYYVYVMAGRKKGTLYIGVTNDLVRRVFEHKNDLVEGFTKKCKVHALVYYEHANDIHSAIEREKTIKKWNSNGRSISSRRRIPAGTICTLNCYK